MEKLLVTSPSFFSQNVYTPPNTNFHFLSHIYHVVSMWFESAKLLSFVKEFNSLSTWERFYKVISEVPIAGKLPQIFTEQQIPESSRLK